ncbi:MAG: spore germination protein, partial [Clostridiales bacterium]|nr:spore germination protein [Clostridiales bacterium]
VGGLIIGQAAVEAGIVSPVVVIIIALTGISSFAIPSVSLVSGFRIVKYLLIVLSAVLGLYGFWLGLILCLIHLVSLKSFGIPYVFPFASGEVNKYSDLKDSLIRAPIFSMKNRPIFADPKEAKRLNTNETGNVRKRE